jgi:H/ACA ribonucleoprotein complex subunit 2
LRTVGAKIRAIHRGVKECEKAIKKSPALQFNPESTAKVPAVLVIAGDISPPEVIEHFPIHCEEHNVPYIFVRSRAELGVAACTKRATSVVLIKPDGKGPAAPKEGATDAEKEVKVDPAEFKEAWTELVKLAQKEYGKQVMPFIQREKRGL